MQLSSVIRWGSVIQEIRAVYLLWGCFGILLHVSRSPWFARFSGLNDPCPRYITEAHANGICISIQIMGAACHTIGDISSDISLGVPTERLALQSKMTVGFLHGAGNNFGDNCLRKNLSPGWKKQKEQCIPRKAREAKDLDIRCRDPNLSGGYQNCGLGIHGWEDLLRETRKCSRQFGVVLAPAPEKEPDHYKNAHSKCFSRFIGRNYKGQTKWDKRVSAKICGFLRFSVKICGFLRFSAKIRKCCNSQEKRHAKSSQQKAYGHLGFSEKFCCDHSREEKTNGHLKPVAVEPANRTVHAFWCPHFPSYGTSLHPCSSWVQGIFRSFALSSLSMWSGSNY